MTLANLAGRHVVDTSIFAQDIIVLRKIDKGAIDPATWDIVATQNLVPHVPERTMPWFAQGFVANDHPRDSFVAQELMDATVGFGIARSDTGQVLREYDGPNALIRAESAAKGARINLAIEVDIDEESKPPQAEPAMNPAEGALDTEPTESFSERMARAKAEKGKA
jgi:hypothetical protein